MSTVEDKSHLSLIPYLPVLLYNVTPDKAPELHPNTVCTARSSLVSMWTSRGQTSRVTDSTELTVSPKI